MFAGNVANQYVPPCELNGEDNHEEAVRETSNLSGSSDPTGADSDVPTPLNTDLSTHVTSSRSEPQQTSGSKSEAKRWRFGIPKRKNDSVREEKKKQDKRSVKGFQKTTASAAAKVSTKTRADCGKSSPESAKRSVVPKTSVGSPNTTKTEMLLARKLALRQANEKATENPKRKGASSKVVTTV